MSIAPSPTRRVLAGVVAFVMAFAAVPLGAMTAAASPAVASKSQPAFARLKGSGPMPPYATRHDGASLVNVRWRTGVTAAQIKAAAKRFGFAATKTSKLGWAQLTPDKTVVAGTLARMLRESRLVTDAQPSQEIKAFDVTPNDPLFPSQWSLLNTGQQGGTPGADISATKAWSQSTGSKDVIVAVVDEGVNWAHSDLKNNMWINTEDVPGNGIDDDKDGYTDDVRGWDFYNYDSTVYDPEDGDRHGTHVAGIIGAEGGNGIGISGVNQHVRIMPVKFLGADGYGTDWDGAQAIVFAVDHGATVINCSWGGGDSDVVHEAVDYAAAHGVIICAAAGNDYANNDDPDWASYPASYDATNVISVAASDRNDDLAEWSNYGSDSVDLAAPGVDVTSTLPKEQSGFYNDNLVSKTVYLPLQAEIMEPASARDALISGAVAQLGEATETPILVVDDSAAKVTSETPGVRLAVYTGALAAAGYSAVTTWSTDVSGTPTQKAMDGKIVVWFTGKDTSGWYGDPCLSEEEQYAIADFLDAGGNAVLISGKAATDLQYFGGMAEDLDLIGQYFGAECVGYETWANSFKGRSTSRLAGLDVSIPAAYTDPASEGMLWPTAADAVVMAGGSLSTTVMYTNDYAPLSGTSMATPQVTGAIALLKAKYPTATSDELVARVLNTVDRKPAFAGKTVTGGRLNVAAAMGAYPGRVSITAPKKGDRLFTGSSSTLRWKPATGAAAGATYTAQIGIPYLSFSQGFEDGTLGTFEEPTESGSPWSASTETTAIHSGSYGAKSGVLPPEVPAPDLGEGWYRMGVSAMQTTVTVPAGGAELSFYWRMPASDGWDTWGFFDAGEQWDYLDPSMVDDPSVWTKQTVQLTAGDHRLEFGSLNMLDEATDTALYIDDITLTAHEFTDIGEAGVGATSLDFTVPSEPTGDAWFRVQSHLDGVDSSWSTVKGVRIVSDAVAPAAPSDLALTPDLDGNIAIAWQNPSDPDYDHTLVLASTDHMPTGHDDASATVAYEGTGTAAAFGPVKDGTDVYVSAWAIDLSGNWSPAASADVRAVDRTAPAPVRSLKVLQPLPGLPMIVWGGAKGAFSTTVLRRYDTTPTVGDTDAMIVDELAPGIALDLDVDQDAPQAYYTVYVTDESGNVSDPRSVRAVLDPTGVVGELTIESNDFDDMTESAIVQTSSVWVDADVTNATEMRYFINDEYDADADWIPYQSRFQVDFLPIQGVQRVTVEFRKSAGDIMSVPLTASALIVLHKPYAPSSLAAKPRNTGVSLTWDVPEDDPTIAAYMMERGLTANGPWAPVAFMGSDEMMSGYSLFVAKLAPGVPSYFRATALDILYRDSDPSTVVVGTPGIGVRRFSGDRASTAAMASRACFEPSTETTPGSDYVVIAPDSNYIQALAANSLAGRYEASVLVAGKTMPAATRAEVQRLGVHRAFVVGTKSAVSSAVDAELKGLGIHVERVGGSDSYAVAANVARRMSASLFGSRDAFVVNGASRSDMCALMPIAYSSGRPIVVVKRTSVPSAFKSLIAKTPLSSVTIVGGPQAVSTKLLHWFGRDAETERIWGKLASDTAAALAERAVDWGWATWENVSVTDPSSWSQSLNIGAASDGGVVLVTSGKSLSAATSRVLKRNAESIDMVTVFGGSGTVSSSVQSKIRSAMSITMSGVIAAPGSSFGPGFPGFPGDGW